MAEAYQPVEGFVDEVWRPVPGWEEAYEVSSLGKVRSLDRVCIRRGPKGDARVKGSLLRPERPGNSKKSRNKLQYNGRCQYFYTDSLVMSAFVGACPEGHEILHLDGDLMNDHLSNLRYVKAVSKEEMAQAKKERQVKSAKLKAFRKELESAIKKAHGYVPSKDELDAAFVYRDGILYWKADRGNHIKAGTQAGTFKRKGYVFISFKDRKYPAHRLIWAMHGNPPAETIDHINRDPSDNRIENLRAATKNEQLFNTGLRPNNKSGIKGVSWNSITKTWRGQVCFRGRTYSAGYFKSKEKCGQAVEALRERLHGEFAHHAIAT